MDLIVAIRCPKCHRYTTKLLAISLVKEVSYVKFKYSDNSIHQFPDTTRDMYITKTNYYCPDPNCLFDFGDDYALILGTYPYIKLTQSEIDDLKADEQGIFLDNEKVNSYLEDMKSLQYVERRGKTLIKE